MTFTRNHVFIGFANPFLICEQDDCKKPVPYWHDPTRCGPSCTAESFNVPCEHQAGIISKCPSWGPVDGCSCDTPCSI